IFSQSTVFGYYEDGNEHVFGLAKRYNGYKEEIYEVRCKSAIFACGAMENMLVFPGNDLPGVYGAGGVQTLMNVHGVKPGKRVLMVGSGNVGLIVSYQLLQAGVEVAAIIEALPKIGGYHVHAAKVRRSGVPILTSHTIIEAEGKDRVEKAKIAKLDENWNVIPGSEKEIKCDTICLAVGLTPSIRLLAQTGADVRFIAEAGGYVALHNKYMETSIKGIYVAGDASGIEEASTAMLEGKIAGLSAAHFVKNREVEDKKIKPYLDGLDRLRSGDFGIRGRKAKEKILSIMEKEYGRV
ncbi:MAG: FAD-dependent oxidoreductase, partial [Thermoplasmata archaeon]|nr:FAD-dependent oxidoreductase [Thermoplasmata archaeon]